MVLARVCQMLERAGHHDRFFPATTYYNENWLLRLVLHWCSENREAIPQLRFPNNARWFSEAWLPSAFLRVQNPEGWTKADGVIGQFSIGADGKADLKLSEPATELKVIEGKKYSRLSPGVSNARYFDQAARTAACIAEVLRIAKHRPEHMNAVAFYVIAPETQIQRGVFRRELDRDCLRRKVEKRVQNCREGDPGQAWLDDWFLPLMNRIEIECVTWESIIHQISQCDPDSGNAIGDFYQRCREFAR